MKLDGEKIKIGLLIFQKIAINYILIKIWFLSRSTKSLVIGSVIKVHLKNQSHIEFPFAVTIDSHINSLTKFEIGEILKWG